MIKRSDELYMSGQYLKNNQNWNVDDSVWKANLINNLYKKNEIHPKSVVDVGCGAGAILENLLLKDSDIQRLDGFDISSQAISLAVKRANEKLSFHQGDFLNESFPVSDLLLLIDVVEHLEDYFDFLRKLRERSRYFIFHIPMDNSCRTILKPHVLLQQRESVGHIHYFSEEMILWLLKDTGYQIIDRHYTKPVIDTKPAKGLKQSIKKVLRNVSFGLNPSLSAKLWGGYSLMILAKPL